MEKVVLSHPVRTAIGGFGGTLKDIPAVDLGVRVVNEVLSAAGVDPKEVDDCIMGNVLGAGLGQNPSRQVAVNSGLGTSTPGFSINRVCGSGLQSVALAAQAIKAEDADVIVAGGIENMSQSPFYLQKARYGFSHTAMPKHDVIDGMVKDGLWDIFNDYHMGVTAENLAEAYNLSKEAQDEFAYKSQMKTAAAMKAGRFDDEIVTVSVPRRRQDPLDFRTDEHPRPDVTQDSLARMRPVFKMGGTVTAGNASGINDGAAAVLVSSESRARELGLKPFAAVVSYAVGAVDPSIMGIGPVPAITKALDKANLSLGDIDLFELNEAFAAQSLAVLSDLPIPDSKVNVNGGAIALGHPIGASGTVILVKLLHEMRKRPSAKRGLAALCVGGGMGVAMIVEKIGGASASYAPATGRRGPGRPKGSGVKRGPGRPKGSGVKRGPGRPKRVVEEEAAPVRRGPGRPKGSGVKRGPGRPKGSGVKRGPGRPKRVVEEEAAPVRRGPGRPKGSGVKRGPGRPKGSGVKRGPGRPKRVVEETAAPVKRGPGRPKGSGVKRGPGRPKGSGVKAATAVKRGPGRPKGSGVKRGPGRPKGSGVKAATAVKRGPGRPKGSGVKRGPGRPKGSGVRRGPGRPRKS